MDTKNSDEKNVPPAASHTSVDISKYYPAFEKSVAAATFPHASPPGHRAPPHLATAWTWTQVDAQLRMLLPGACSSDIRSALMEVEVQAQTRSYRAAKAGSLSRCELWTAVAHAVSDARAALDVLSIGEPSVSLSYSPAASREERDKRIDEEGSDVYARPSGQSAAVMP